MRSSCMRGVATRTVSICTVCVLCSAFALAACGSSSTDNPDASAPSDSGAGGPCSAGSLTAISCSGNVLTVCAADGGSPTVTDCTAAGQTCAAGLGCIACMAGSASCASGQAKVCRADGSGYIEFECDPVQGMTCTPTGCTGECATAAADQSYIGCDYYPTVTLNPVWSGFTFAAAVANAGDQVASITVTQGASSILQTTIMPQSLQAIALPWVPALKGGDVDACQNTPDPGVTRIVTQGAYRLRSTGPVSVYQLSPLEYQLSPVPAGCPVADQCPGGIGSECLSYSNDASLLLPVTALTGDYTALTWASTPTDAALIAVTATQDDTVVQLTPQGQFAAGAGIDAMGGGTVTLSQGDVLELVATHDTTSGYGSDLSGTHVHASHPVQVIAGHSCANIPTAATGYCDHLEQSMFPDEVLGMDYLVTFPRAEVGNSPHEIRIAASLPTTHVHFDPALMADSVLAPGTPLTLTNVTEDVRITSDQPILIAQYMPGSTSLPDPVGSGDPSLSMAIPTLQFRDNYIFIASHTYFVNFVNVIAPAGATVTLDGAPIDSSEFSPIGASGYAVARHQLSMTDNHSITAPQPFGIVVYGYGEQTSYMYPGGLDVRALNPTPPPPQ